MHTVCPWNTSNTCGQEVIPCKTKLIKRNETFLFNRYFIFEENFFCKCKLLYLNENRVYTDEKPPVKKNRLFRNDRQDKDSDISYHSLFRNCKSSYHNACHSDLLHSNQQIELSLLLFYQNLQLKFKTMREIHTPKFKYSTVAPFLFSFGNRM